MRRAPVYTKAPPVVAPVPLYNWTGFYIGGHVGGSFRGDNGIAGTRSDGRFIGGGQVGVDYQFAPTWVMGLEANYSAMANSDFTTFGNRALGSVTGRLGYTWGQMLLYAKGGYAWADTRRNFGFANGGRDGYTVGGGLEYMFAPNWSAKVEYQYYDLGRVNFIAPVANFRNDEHTIKLGVNYRFNWGGGATASAY
jgi:outer membrane immunogenic protein